MSTFNSTALELYIYMGSSDKVIAVLKEQGIKTREQAIQFLRPYIRGIVMDSMRVGGSLASSSSAAGKILNAFPESVKKSNNKNKGHGTRSR